jgi:hypothetical protein
MGVRLRDGLLSNKEPPLALSVSEDLQLSLLELAFEERAPASFVMFGFQSNSF